MSFKPMLAAKANVSKIRFPISASPKMDGIRCSILNGVPVTRSLKSIPNHFIAGALTHNLFEGLDGELICGEPFAKDVYLKTNSAVMSHEGIPPFTFFVFDKFYNEFPFIGFHDRMRKLFDIMDPLYDLAQARGFCMKYWTNTLIKNQEELDEYERVALEQGYEGVILRGLSSVYKFGRSTVKEGGMLKLKRFEDDEGTVIGFEEEMHNTNMAMTNQLGRTERSSAQAGLVGKGTLGALVCHTKDGIEFRIGTGFDAAQRTQLWQNREALVGKLVKYKHFTIGAKIKPRHPVFLGFRDLADT